MKIPLRLKDCLESVQLAREYERVIAVGKSEPAVLMEDLVLRGESLRERLVAYLFWEGKNINCRTNGDGHKT